MTISEPNPDVGPIGEEPAEFVEPGEYEDDDEHEEDDELDPTARPSGSPPVAPDSRAAADVPTLTSVLFRSSSPTLSPVEHDSGAYDGRYDF
jgi:hypothetical protein